MIVLLVSLLAGGMRSCSSSSAGVTTSTVERTALPASATTETAYFTDADGGWISSPSKLEKGLKAFYRETGVQPYVYILPNGEETSASELGNRADALYDELFQDEGHFLLVFCDDGAGSFNCGYTIGSQAKSVMDNEAVEILSDYLDRYYNDYDLSEEEIFSKAFEDTGERIMTVTPSPFRPLAIAAVVVGVGAVIAFIVKRRSDDKRREQEHTERVLNTPLEKFGDADLHDLEKKYESAAKGSDSSSSSDSNAASNAASSARESTGASAGTSASNQGTTGQEADGNE